jgi:hypothetical protein
VILEDCRRPVGAFGSVLDRLPGAGAPGYIPFAPRGARPQKLPAAQPFWERGLLQRSAAGVFRGMVLLVRRGVGPFRGGGLPKSPAIPEFRPAVGLFPGILVPTRPAVQGFRGKVEGFRVWKRPFRGIRLPPGSWALQFRVREKEFREWERQSPEIRLRPESPVQGFRGIWLRPSSADREFAGIYG